MLYVTLKAVHIACAIASIAGFALRGILMLADSPLLATRSRSARPPTSCRWRSPAIRSAFSSPCVPPDGPESQATRPSRISACAAITIQVMDVPATRAAKTLEYSPNACTTRAASSTAPVT